EDKMMNPKRISQHRISATTYMIVVHCPLTKELLDLGIKDRILRMSQPFSKQKILENSSGISKNFDAGRELMQIKRCSLFWLCISLKILGRREWRRIDRVAKVRESGSTLVGDTGGIESLWTTSKRRQRFDVICYTSKHQN